MCTRRRDPYKGLRNLVGGKIEIGEAGLDAAYRELREETGITREDVALHHLMDFRYSLQQCYVEVYVGRLRSAGAVSGDENALYWSRLDDDFFDLSRYAGEGHIGHMVEQAKRCGERLLANERP